MIVNEIFGPTFQGEGPSAGQRCGFVRLGRCNLTCTWCDTPYTWDWSGANGTDYDPKVELHEYDIAGVVTQLTAMDVSLVVITGGEPLVQRSAVLALATVLGDLGIRVEVETNGTISPSKELLGAVNQCNVGIKLANSGVEEPKRIVPSAIEALRQGPSIFKFVATSVDDLDEVSSIQKRFALEDDAIWILPEGTSSNRILDQSSLLAPYVLDRKWNLSTRLHILLWEDKRGV